MRQVLFLHSLHRDIALLVLWSQFATFAMPPISQRKPLMVGEFIRLNQILLV